MKNVGIFEITKLGSFPPKIRLVYEATGATRCVIHGEGTGEDWDEDDSG